METRYPMEGEFHGMASQIARIASEEGITVRDLSGMIVSEYGEINCYPGSPSDRCHHLAFFFSLHGKLAKGRGHYYFGEMLQKFVQHMQGYCSQATKHAVIVADSWHAGDYEVWAGNVRAIALGARIEIYLIGYGGWVVPIQL